MTLDLLLVNAPSRQRVYGGLTQFAAIEPPVWAGLIARHCLNKGFSVQVLGAEAEGLTVDETAQRIIDAKPRLAAFAVYGQQPSASTQCLPAASDTSRAVKDEVDIPTLALGTHMAALPDKTAWEEPFDIVARGDGVNDVIAALSGQPQCTNNVLDLDADLPGQAWELLNMKRYRAHNWHLWSGNPNNGYASVQTSLGCPFRCSFCCINAPFGGAGIRYWSPKVVVDQIEVLINRYGITNIKIPDEMFCLNRKHVMGICDKLIDRDLHLDLNMWAYARVDTVKDHEMLNYMRWAGFRWLGIGIESGSKHVRDGVDKGRFDSDDIFAAVKRVQNAGLHVAANYIFGLPDDTRESMQETLDLACSLNTEWANFYCAMAYPGSPLHNEISRSNPSVLPENNPCGWIGYSQHAPECLPLPTCTLSAAQVLRFRDDAFMHYFSRPEYQSMVLDKFGLRAGPDVQQMIAVGRPERNLLKGIAT